MYNTAANNKFAVIKYNGLPRRNGAHGFIKGNFYIFSAGFDSCRYVLLAVACFGGYAQRAGKGGFGNKITVFGKQPAAEQRFCRAYRNVAGSGVFFYYI